MLICFVEKDDRCVRSENGDNELNMTEISQKSHNRELFRESPLACAAQKIEKKFTELTQRVSNFLNFQSKWR